MELSKLYRKFTNKPLKVYWWRYEYPHKLNFGDELTPQIIERVFSRKTVWAEPKDCEIAGAGSIIELLQSLSEGNRINVWGSGFIQPGSPNKNENLVFNAVRGEQSLARVDTKKIAIGDPGLLVPLAFTPKTTKRFKLGIIPHYVDADSDIVKELVRLGDVTLINPLDTVENVAKHINSCELIFSSSLHGLIVSDAFGIPNYWTPFSNKLTGGSYKFDDYYSVFNLKSDPLLIQDVTKLNLVDLISSYKKKQGVEKIQQDLIKAFPF